MLKITHFSKIYKGNVKAVDDLSLSILPGDIYGFIGHNGAGKSTTIRAIVGVLDFTDGDILIDGHSIKREPLLCKQITAYIPDNPDLYDHLTGIQYLNFICDIYQVSRADREKRIGRLGDDFEITADLGDSISAYSHGMKQKLALISALAHNPRLMVLDEPFVGLDPKAALTLKNLMKEICASGGAIFFSTHVLDVAEKLCNKIAIINKGRLAASGNIGELVRDKSLEHLFMEVAAHEQ
ncbi:MAG: ABC transporter ATP-binding protein [Lachnospiraceae bacterium]|jgi:ABC-2 type transport system ATP-binding protein|nr:ABC transporter ATP-binding protein [Lachnospiraceae bacterium]